MQLGLLAALTDPVVFIYVIICKHAYHISLRAQLYNKNHNKNKIIQLTREQTALKGSPLLFIPTNPSNLIVPHSCLNSSLSVSWINTHDLNYPRKSANNGSVRPIEEMSSRAEAPLKRISCLHSFSVQGTVSMSAQVF